MKIVQLVVYVSPRGAIIAKCEIALIQRNFNMLFVIYLFADFWSVVMLKNYCVGLQSFKLFLLEVLIAGKGKNQNLMISAFYKKVCDKRLSLSLFFYG